MAQVCKRTSQRSKVTVIESNRQYYVIVELFLFEGRKVKILALHEIRYTLKKNSCRFFIQSEVKPNSIVTSKHAFSRALSQLLRVLIGSYSLCSSVIGQSVYFGFSFTTLNETHLESVRESKRLSKESRRCPLTSSGFN